MRLGWDAIFKAGSFQLTPFEAESVGVSQDVRDTIP